MGLHLIVAHVYVVIFNFMYVGLCELISGICGLDRQMHRAVKLLLSQAFAECPLSYLEFFSSALCTKEFKCWLP